MLKESFLVRRIQRKEELLYSIHKRNVKLVKDILSHSRKDELPRNFPFGDDFRKLIFKDGRIEIVEHFEIVKMIISNESVDPSAEDNFALVWASEKGYYEIVKLLISDERDDPSSDDNYAIVYASENGHYEIAKLLLSDKRVDPSAGDN